MHQLPPGHFILGKSGYKKIPIGDLCRDHMQFAGLADHLGKFQQAVRPGVQSIQPGGQILVQLDHRIIACDADGICRKPGRLLQNKLAHLGPDPILADLIKSHLVPGSELQIAPGGKEGHFQNRCAGRAYGQLLTCVDALGQLGALDGVYRPHAGGDFRAIGQNK